LKLSRRAFRRSELGAAALELAVALPVLTLLALGVVEYGRLYFTGITLASAARAGAQFGAQTLQSSNFAGMNQAAQNDAGDVGSITTVASQYCRCPDGSTPSCTSGNCGAYGVPEVFVKDSVTKTVSFLIKYPGLPTSLTISRVATFRAQ